MGWNAGGYGTMTFPDAAAVDAWRASTVRHGDHDDWIDELETGVLGDATVARRLAAFAKMHDAERYALSLITTAGTTVDLVFDTGEDNFRDHAGDVAALMRSGAPFGAKGAFWFLGTAGAEHDFAYALTLDGKRSTVKRLTGAALEKAYGPAYEAFIERCFAMLAATDPAFREALDDEGGTPAKKPVKPKTSTSKRAKQAKAEVRGTVSKKPVKKPVSKPVKKPVSKPVKKTKAKPVKKTKAKPAKKTKAKPAKKPAKQR